MRLLDVPQVHYPYYWSLKVSSHGVWVALNRRPLGLFRNAICSKATEYVSHRDVIDGELLNRIEKTMRKIHTGVVDQLAAKLATHVPKSVKVKVDR